MPDLSQADRDAEAERDLQVVKLAKRRVTRRLVAALMLGLAFLTGASSSRRPTAPPFFFIQMSDPQFGMYAADSNFAQETANFEMAIATANRLHPAFVVVTGDLINKPGDAAQAAEYWRIAKQLDASIPAVQRVG